MFTRGFLALAVYRFGNWAAQQPAPLRAPALRLYGWTDKLTRVLTGVHMDRQVRVGRGFHIIHAEGNISIHPEAVIGARVGIMHNVTIGTDGNNASNYSDLMRATYLVAGLFKDARTDPQMFPAEKAYEMATLGGAKAMRLDDRIGSLEAGKQADIVLHDTDRPEWRPLLNVANQLVWSADGRGVHTVLVDGRVVVDGGRCVTVDEDKLWADAQLMGEAITARSGLPDKAKWPIL